MNKKLTSILLSTAISCYLLNSTTVYAQSSAEEISVSPKISIDNNVDDKVSNQMVRITHQPLKQDKVITDKNIQNIVLADKNATEKTKELMAYLKDIAKQDKVIFGHQNDIFNRVTPNMLNPEEKNKLQADHNSPLEIASVQEGMNSTFTKSNVKEITGSISGIFGIDSLALTGSELYIKNSQQALQKSIDLSIKAANDGALITLSTHMPNFGSKNIKKLSDGTYDFSNCDFMDCKNLSGSAKDILPGGKNNEAFNAYIDIIANYALQLQEKNIPVIFRPFHENNGSWFWWGGDNISPKDSIELYKYMIDRLQNQGIHNFIYVYSPNGPINNEQEYMSRYPGDDYVDILAVDYYDDYNTSPAKYREDFFTQLNSSCLLLNKIAKEHNKLSAIAETGVRVMKKDLSSNDGLLISDNPIAGHNWFKRVSQIAINNDMPYYLVWANFSPYNCYIPYKYNDNYGHELINEFIDFYNWDKSIFATETNFY